MREMRRPNPPHTKAAYVTKKIDVRSHGNFSASHRNVMGQENQNMKLGRSEYDPPWNQVLLKLMMSGLSAAYSENHPWPASCRLIWCVTLPETSKNYHVLCSWRMNAQRCTSTSFTDQNCAENSPRKISGSDVRTTC